MALEWEGSIDWAGTEWRLNGFFLFGFAVELWFAFNQSQLSFNPAKTTTKPGLNGLAWLIGGCCLISKLNSPRQNVLQFQKSNRQSSQFQLLLSYSNWIPKFKLLKFWFQFSEIELVLFWFHSFWLVFNFRIHFINGNEIHSEIKPEMKSNKLNLLRLDCIRHSFIMA